MLSGNFSEQRSGAALASAACTNYDRLRRLRGEAGVSHPSTTKPQARRQAWVTLLTDASYFAGVKALYQSLVESDAEYPLIVMVTAGVPGDVLSRLTDLGPEISLRRANPCHARWRRRTTVCVRPRGLLGEAADVGMGG